MNTYELYLDTPFGERVAVLAPLSFSYTLATNDVGALTVELPASFDTTLVTRDSRVEVWRSVDGATPYLEGEQHWLVRKVTTTVTAERRVTLRAVGAADLLRRRRIAYDAGTAYTTKSGAADDVLKAFVRENLGSLVDSNRDYTAGINVSSLLAVQGDAGLGATVSVAATRDRLLDTLQKVAQAATQAGKYLAFDIVWNGTRLEFRTYVGQRGIDHRFPGGLNPVILSAENGTLFEAIQDDDWTDEVTVVIAGGSGQGASRAIGTAADVARRDASPFGAIEEFTQQTDTASSSVLASLAAAHVRAGRPRQVLEGRVQDAPGVRYGREWGWGDYVTIQVEGVNADARVEAVTVSVEGARETIDAQVRADG
jgi:hypothetical protein